MAAQAESETCASANDRMAHKRPADPRVSIVVTCYNYGHFLENCLDSILVQSQPAAQIVVVDDGSTDATGQILERYASRVEVIHTKNLGQAAAFNTGFAAATGDIILFLDADDLLRPEAIEVLFHHWSDDLAVLNFGLDTIDEAGRSTGLYTPSIHSDSGDNRPRLLQSGTFAFPPTSGNAFARSLLDAVLPMPEARWRISADCYLIRAAALFGRFGHVPQVLGSYRIHGGNNYALGLEGFHDLARDEAHQREIADALLTLAEAADLFSQDPDEAAALSYALRHRAELLVAQQGTPTAAKGRLLRLTGARGVAAAKTSAVASGKRDKRRRKGTDTATQLLWFQRLASSRWPVHVPFDRWIDVGDGGTYQNVMTADLGDGSTYPRGTIALEFTLDPTPAMLLVTLQLNMPPDPAECAPEATISIGGEAIWRGAVVQEVQLPVRQAPWEARRKIRIDIAFFADPDSQVLLPRDRCPTVGKLQISTKGSAGPAPFIDGIGYHPIATALAAGLDSDEWEVDSEDGATMRASTARMRFSALSAGSCELLLAFGAFPPRGWLHVRQGQQSLFTGWLGDATSLAINLPRTPQHVGPHDLSLHFEGSATAGDQRLRIAEIGFREYLAAELGSSSAKFLNLGETVFPGRDMLQSRFLVSGWEESDGTPARNAASEASLAFRTPECVEAVSLVMSIEPVLDPVPGVRHIIGVSQDGDLRAAVQLDGAGTIEVPLRDPADQHEVGLVLHSTFVSELPDGGAGVGPVAPVALVSFELRGREGIAARPRLPRAHTVNPPSFRAMMDAAAKLFEPVAETKPAELARMRATLSAFIDTCDPKACLLIASAPRDMDFLVRIGEGTVHVPRTEAEESLLRTATARTSGAGGADQLRVALLSLLNWPACTAPLDSDLERLPAPLLWKPDTLARYFGRPPEVHDDRMHRAYVIYLERLLASIDRVLAREPKASALFELAAATLRTLRSTRVIFGKGVLRDLIRLRSRCIERLLTRSGARLAMPRVPNNATRRLRIGVLVRDVLPHPEGWAVLGMYRDLDPMRFEAVLIRMDRSDSALGTGAIFSEELCLAGRSIDDSVTAIRALSLDLFVIGCYVADWEKTSAICAHRLAPVQVWAGAICPTTGGFRSFDYALTCRATEPEAPERHYTETLAWIEGPLQWACAFPKFVVPQSAKIRRELGIKKDAVMLVSGAMAHKITDALLTVWADILHGVPDAVLVLYPFATNWSMDFAHEAFRARLAGHLAKAGVGQDRVLLLWTQTPDRVRQIASCADLYLDSFPYAGATTVCEALSCGTPVLTCEGDALRQLTGASWVRAYGLPELVAGSPEEYRALARRLGTERSQLRALRKRLATTLQSGRPPHDNSEAFGPAFSDALWQIARTSGLFPQLADARDVSVPKRTVAQGPSDFAPQPLAAPFPARSSNVPVKLAIFASPRTGSTLLCGLLNRTPGVVCHYELFHDDMIQFSDRTVSDPEALGARNADPIGFLDRVYAEAAAEGRSLMGFKHFAHLSSVVSQAAIADPATRLIHLRRGNFLAQYSSEKIAKSNGKWFSRRGERPEQVRIKFDRDDFEAREQYQRRIECEWMNLFAASSREPLFIDFTKILDPATPARLSRFLGVEIASSGIPDLHRQNAPVILDRFTNRHEVARYLAKRGLSHWGEAG
ncbi:glycosyltransferase [Mesorhizobium sp.]|uniref:glycosyltransferase n=1 Tax=Mesorhizobium sp. TaxID=1871066 RepID=UPI000FE68BE0|nr:glycosyltransferase [Mesorhizobium sp.]RWO63269.1 MAG: glycosyltransferase [Mesorhizobium sp.]